jgi:hypothetical protein
MWGPIMCSSEEMSIPEHTFNGASSRTRLLFSVVGDNRDFTHSDLGLYNAAVVRSNPEHPTLALQIALLKEVDSGNLDNLECPKCRRRAVSAWFTNPAPEAYRTWLICAECDFGSHLINSTKPSFFSESRVRSDLQEKDVAILKAMCTRKE